MWCETWQSARLPALVTSGDRGEVGGYGGDDLVEGLGAVYGHDGQAVLGGALADVGGDQEVAADVVLAGAEWIAREGLPDAFFAEGGAAGVGLALELLVRDEPDGLMR